MTARIGRRRRHKLHKRFGAMRSRLRQWFTHVTYDYVRCLTVIHPRSSKVCMPIVVSDAAMSGRTDGRWLAAFVGGHPKDWQRPGFAARLLAPLARGGR